MHRAGVALKVQIEHHMHNSALVSCKIYPGMTPYCFKVGANCSMHENEATINNGHML